MARRGSVISHKEWQQGSFSRQAISAAGTFAGGGLDFAQPITVLRSRGYVQAAFDETVQAGDTMLLTFGLGIVSTDAANLGATALPDPGSDVAYPWLWWGEMFLEAFAADVATLHAWGSTNQRLEVDTKAMRRARLDQSLIWVIEAAQVTGAPVTNVEIGTTRILVGQ